MVVANAYVPELEHMNVEDGATATGSGTTRAGIQSMVGAAIILTMDYLLGVRAYVSLGLTLLESTLAIPFIIGLFRRDRTETSSRLLQKSRGFVLLVRIASAGVLLLSLVQKWLVVIQSNPPTSEWVGTHRIYTAALLVSVAIGLLTKTMGAKEVLIDWSEKPQRLATMAFGLLGIIGALLLALPQAVRGQNSASFIDSLFTAVSAVCVTGLVVHNVAETYTPFGQTIILVLIQVGGLGIMTLSSVLVFIAGNRLRFRSQAVLAQAVDASSAAQLKRIVLGAIAYTLLFESIGTAILYAFFRMDSDGAAAVWEPFWQALFHAVSAFCNAGFSILESGMEPYFNHWGINFALMLLIVAGGLGFPVLDELGQRLWQKVRGQRPDRLSLNTRVVLWTSLCLTLVTAAVFGALEWNNALKERTFFERILGGLFQSITARTAGFNTVDFSQVGAPALMFICLVMFVGASPGSTGGGIKTTSLAILFATFRAEAANSKDPHLLGRKLSTRLVKRVLGVFFTSVLVVSAVMFCLLVTEDAPSMAISFEAFSAFATVGLSTGLTQELSVAGKLLVTLTMLVGRVGPLAFALALMHSREPSPCQFPKEDVLIG